MIVEAWIKAIHAIMQHSSAQLCSSIIYREKRLLIIMRSNDRWLRRRVYESPASGLGLGAQLSERQRLNVLPPSTSPFYPSPGFDCGCVESVQT